MTTLLALAGMPGAGKSTVSAYLHERWGVPTYYVGSLLVEKCKQEHVEPTYSNRMELGRRCGLIDSDNPLSLVKNSYEHLREMFQFPACVLIDSVRSGEELNFLRAQEPDVAVVAVVLGRKVRHERLSRRDSSTIQQIEHRDAFELGKCADYGRHFEVGNIIALADYYILEEDDNALMHSCHAQVDMMMQTITK